MIKLLSNNLAFCYSSLGVLLCRDWLHQPSATGSKGEKYSDSFKHKIVFSLPARLMGAVLETLYKNEAIQSSGTYPFIV